MKKPVVLRDVRRCVERFQFWWTRGVGLDVHFGWVDLGRPTPREVDQLIARFGARAPVAEVLKARREERKKTQDVAPSAQAGGEVHGGDGASGEVEKSAPTGAQEARDDHEGVEASAPPAIGAGRDGGTPSSPDRPAGDNAGAERGHDEPARAGYPSGSVVAVAAEPSPACAGEATEDLDGDLAEADASPRDAESGACASEETGEVNRANASGDGGPVTSPPRDPEDGVDDAEGGASVDPIPGCPDGTRAGKRVPICSYGGDTAESWEYVSQGARKHRRAAQEVERALRRLIQQVDMGGLDESPRGDGRRLVRELVSRRCAIGRAVRREAAVPSVVLACDVSGSCSAVSTETLTAATAIAADLPQVVVVRHSNGVVIDVVGHDARRRELLSQKAPASICAVLRAIGRPVAAVVAWGDWDAGAQYHELCEAGAALYWLDSYAAKHGARPAGATLRADAQSWKRQPSGWWQGVNDAATTAIALRAMSVRR